MRPPRMLARLHSPVRVWLLRLDRATVRLAEIRE